MQTQPDLATNLQNLFDPNSYKEFGEGEFVNQPKMTGVFYIFKKMTKPKLCLIVNTSNVPYGASTVRIQEYVFLVIQAKSVEDYFQNLADVYFPEILELVNESMNKKDDRNLPYGYYTDENGELKIDLVRAQEVKKIYNMYIETESVREIADEMRTNFSFIRDILHDNEEYMQMQQKIVPITLLKKVNELLASNVKGRFKKETTMDKIKAIRQQRKEREKAAAMQ